MPLSGAVAFVVLFLLLLPRPLLLVRYVTVSRLRIRQLLALKNRDSGVLEN